MFSLRMRRNVYLGAYGKNSDIGVRLIPCPRFSYTLDKLNVRHISTSGLFDLLT